MKKLSSYKNINECRKMNEFIDAKDGAPITIENRIMENHSAAA